MYFRDGKFSWRNSSEVAVGVLAFSGIKWGLEFLGAGIQYLTSGSANSTTPATQQQATTNSLVSQLGKTTSLPSSQATTAGIGGY